jgi:hypothetical protein
MRRGTHARGASARRLSDARVDRTPPAGSARTPRTWVLHALSQLEASTRTAIARLRTDGIV